MALGLASAMRERERLSLASEVPGSLTLTPDVCNTDATIGLGVFVIISGSKVVMRQAFARAQHSDNAGSTDASNAEGLATQ